MGGEGKVKSVLDLNLDYIEVKVNQICPAASHLNSGYIPGLDAHLCRCPSCRQAADNGIWYASPEREMYFKRRRAERKRAAGLGDVQVEDADNDGKAYIGKKGAVQKDAGVEDNQYSLFT